MNPRIEKSAGFSVGVNVGFHKSAEPASEGASNGTLTPELGGGGPRCSK
jgi:hypothetical protein